VRCCQRLPDLAAPSEDKLRGEISVQRAEVTQEGWPLSRPKKTAELVAEHIVANIRDSGFEPGTSLPTEREMLAQYRVGRGTLREALRYLEIQGVIRIKTGPGGGPVVSSMNAQALASTLSLRLTLDRTPFVQIVEARQILEPTLAQMAAENATKEQITAITESVGIMHDNLDNERVCLQENQRFHDLVAEASGNDIFFHLVLAISWIIDGSAIGFDYPRQQLRDVCKAHGRIAGAIEAGDAKAAHDAMAKHLLEFSRYLEQQYPEGLARPVRWDPSG
jgi:GntR family transcriptional repressor for pyruvate dehydrogenase complex